MEGKLNELKTRLGEIRDLNRASALLGWDQQTYMPPGGAAARAEQLATLQKTAHDWFIADEIGELLEALRGAGWDYDSDEASLVRVASRDYVKARKVPSELVAEFARATALAYEAWTKARQASDFPLFQPHLEKIVELNVSLAEALGYQDRIYDPLLDQYETEMKTAQVAAIFDSLKTELIPFVQAIAGQAGRVDKSVLYRTYDEQKQLEFGLSVIKDFGFDFTRGRQDKSVHPFTTSFSIGDVRLTTRVDATYLPMALFGTLHECGHGLYEQGISPALERTSLDDGASLGIHESQSRMRVEADEVTYNLHIMLRFELENDMLEGKVKIADMPEAWNAKMKGYLGVVPPDDAQGVLQDIHWSGGTIGYFPTYSLGNLVAVQLFDQARADIPALPAQIAAGQFGELLDWLRQNVHRHGRKYTPAELVKRVTGHDLTAANYVAYIKAKFSDIYGL
jgi:carboxypeptidase Taq